MTTPTRSPCRTGFRESPASSNTLFQPIAGGFDNVSLFQMAIWMLRSTATSTTHAISNRMVAGPDSGLSGAQAGAMERAGL